MFRIRVVIRERSDFTLGKFEKKKRCLSVNISFLVTLSRRTYFYET